MVHSQRPLQEKMALFWHNHFATAFSKVNGTFGSVHATKMMAGRPDQVAGGISAGSISCSATWRPATSASCSIEVARDPAMLVWLDGRNNTRGAAAGELRPRDHGALHDRARQLHRSRRLAAARVFTGWGLRLPGDRATPETSYYEFVYNAKQARRHRQGRSRSRSIRTAARTIPARPAAQGMQDGLDLIAALARHPATAHRLARKLYGYFISEVATPDERVVSDLANAFMQNDGNIKAVLRRLFSTEAFLGLRVRALLLADRVRRAVDQGDRLERPVGRRGDDAARQHGPALYEPPDVNGWALGAEWFSTASMLSRMNFAATLMGNQKFNLGRELQPYRQIAERVVDYMLNHFTYSPITPGRLQRAARVRARRRGVDRQRHAVEQQGRRPRAPDRGVVRVPVQLRAP